MCDLTDTMLRIGGRFGLTPAYRARLDVSVDAPKSRADRFFN
jgi:phage terminase small subunit